MKPRGRNGGSCKSVVVPLYCDFVIQTLVEMPSSSSCCVPNCNVTRDDKIHLHTFPNPEKDPERFRSWQCAVAGDLLNLDKQFIYKYRKVCHKHFESKYHTWTKTLSVNAVPTLHVSAGTVSNKDLNVIIKKMSQKIDSYTSRLKKAIKLSENKTYQCGPNKFNFGTAAKAEAEIKRDGSSESGGDETKLDLSFERDHSYVQSCHEPIKEEGPFSWQKVTEDIDTLDEKNSAVDVKFCSEAQLVPDACEPARQRHEEFTCNICQRGITGFRYACVQCIDWDLCGACEARGEHARHYVLRVPPHKTHSETQAVLASLRQTLTTAKLREPACLPEVKQEMQSDDPFETPQDPCEGDAQADCIDDMQEMVEEYLEIDSSSVDSTETEYKDSLLDEVSTAQTKRKMAENADIDPVSPIKRKCIEDRTQKSSVVSLKKAGIRKENLQFNKMERPTKSFPVKALYKTATSENRDKIEGPTKFYPGKTYKGAKSEKRDKMERPTKSFLRVKTMYKTATSENRDKIEGPTKFSPGKMYKAVTIENRDKMERPTKFSPGKTYKGKTSEIRDKMERPTKLFPVKTIYNAATSEDRDKMEHPNKTFPGPVKTCKGATSDNVCVNLTKLTTDEILTATRPTRSKRKK